MTDGTPDPGGDRSVEEASQRLWREFVRLSHDAADAGSRFVEEAPQPATASCRSLLTAAERPLALDVLGRLPEEERRRCLAELVAACATEHVQLAQARRVLALIERAWLVGHLAGPLEAVLARADADDDDDDDEPYRRLAELARLLGATELLAGLAERARRSANPDVREVGDDAAGWVSEAAGSGAQDAGRRLA